MTRAMIMKGYGPPDVLVAGEVEVGEPGPGQIRVAVRCAGVGPTDLEVRAGYLQAVYPLGPGAVLGFEAAGVVEAAGAGVDDVRPGDAVAVLLPELGAYAEQVLATYWVRKPESVSWADAAACPASAEAAVRVLDQLGLAAGETLLLLGGAGSVGTIATQLAGARGAAVIAAVRPDDFAVVEKLGATPVAYGDGLADRVRAETDRVDAVMDAAGRGGLPDGLQLAGGPQRVITLSDPHAADLGVRLSSPVPDRIRPGLEAVMPMLASGALALRHRITAPLGDAAHIHRRLESRDIRDKVVLTI